MGLKSASPFLCVHIFRRDNTGRDFSSFSSAISCKASALTSQRHLLPIGSNAIEWRVAEVDGNELQQLSTHLSILRILITDPSKVERLSPTGKVSASGNRQHPCFKGLHVPRPIRNASRQQQISIDNPSHQPIPLSRLTSVTVMPSKRKARSSSAAVKPVAAEPAAANPAADEPAAGSRARPRQTADEHQPLPHAGCRARRV